ncbi:PLP-dependent aminotransferase family protein, partial [Streptomyces inhibens]
MDDYRVIADELAADIAAGRLRPGDRLLPRGAREPKPDPNHLQHKPGHRVQIRARGLVGEGSAAAAGAHPGA